MTCAVFSTKGQRERDEGGQEACVSVLVEGAREVMEAKLA